MGVRTRSRIVGGSLLVVLLALSGCGGDSESGDGSEESTAVADSTAAVVFDLDDSSSAGDVDVDADVETFRQRLDALGIDGDVEADESSITVMVPTGDAPVVREVLALQGRLEFRPVLEDLGEIPADDGAPADSASADAAADAEVTLVDGNGYGLRLGPTALTGAVIESAAVQEGGDGRPAIALVMRPGADGIDSFNEVAAACYSGAPVCPAIGGGGYGRLAIVFDGSVLSAPTIAAADFERDAIQISGEFSEADARSTAAALDGGGLDGRWVARA